MKKIFNVKYDVKVSYSSFEEATVEAFSKEEAEEIVKEKIKGKLGHKIVHMTSSEVEYLTEKWRDVEDVIKSINAEIAEADEEDVDMHTQDRDDWKHILKCLVNNDFDEAAKRYERLDTNIRDYAPERIYNLFEALELI
jgi:hypothetical protein